jgi:hypothetical protein
MIVFLPMAPEETVCDKLSVIKNMKHLKSPYEFSKILVDTPEFFRNSTFVRTAMSPLQDNAFFSLKLTQTSFRIELVTF